MPTKLYYFKTRKQLLKWCRQRGYSIKACEEAWSGPGYYYARSRSHISKHVEHLDKRRGGKVGKGEWRHIHDLERVIRRLNKRVRKSVEKRTRILEKKRIQRRKAEKIVLAKTIRRARKLPKTVMEIAAYLWNNIPRKYKEGRNRKWTFISTIALAKAIHRLARENDIDWKSIDWVHEIDWAQGYKYALNEVRRLLGATKDYTGLSEKEIREMMKYYEKLGGDVNIEIELDPVKIWELKHMF